MFAIFRGARWEEQVSERERFLEMSCMICCVFAFWKETNQIVGSLSEAEQKSFGNVVLVKCRASDFGIRSDHSPQMR